MAYNMTFLDNTTTFTQLVEHVNELTSGGFVIYILVFTWLICFSLFREYEVVDNIMISSFVSMTIGILFIAIGLGTWAYVTPLIILFISVLLVKFIKK